jgi:5-methylcytosine-specific restriction enzyme subunit McrC
LKRRVKDLALRKRLQHLCFYFEELEIPGDVRSLLEHMQFDRQTGRLEPAFRIARLILSRMSVLQRGAQEESLSFLFEINSLYETYIGIVLQQMFSGSNTIVRLQHEQVKLLKNDDSGRDNIQLIPDMVLGTRHEDGREVWTTIIDTKWKTSNYQQDDIYQMYAYVTGYLDAVRAILLYPKAEEIPIMRNWSLSADNSKRIHVRSVRVDHLAHTREDLMRILEDVSHQ